MNAIEVLLFGAVDLALTDLVAQGINPAQHEGAVVGHVAAALHPKIEQAVRRWILMKRDIESAAEVSV
jgi:hypothetical protein